MTIGLKRGKLQFIITRYIEEASNGQQRPTIMQNVKKSKSNKTRNKFNDNDIIIKL